MHSINIIDLDKTTIDETYVDGVSLTHGSLPRKHIWTFAAAYDESRSTAIVCPCTRPDLTYTGAVPPFIGQDYFCETGRRNVVQYARFYSEDPLWDGQGCGAQSTCCSLTTLHGSASNSHSQPEMILSSGCVLIKQLVMRTLHLRSWKYISSDRTTNYIETLMFAIVYYRTVECTAAMIIGIQKRLKFIFVVVIKSLCTHYYTKHH